MTPPIVILHGDDEKIIFEVPSSTSDDPHVVVWDFDDGWLCSCPGCLKGRHLCKHILACERYMQKMNMALLDDLSVFTGGVIDG